MTIQASFSTRLKWFLVILIAVIITLVGILLLYHDVTEERKDMPTSVYVAEPTETETVPEYSGEKLDINRASLEELQTLPGIGETLAKRIVAYRENKPFKVVRDLKKVPGIGDKKFNEISGRVEVLSP